MMTAEDFPLVYKHPQVPNEPSPSFQAFRPTSQEWLGLHARQLPHDLHDIKRVATQSLSQPTAKIIVSIITSGYDAVSKRK